MNLDGEVEDSLKQSKSDPPKVYPPAKKSDPKIPTSPTLEGISAEKALAEVLGDTPPCYITPLDAPPNTERQIVQVQMPPPPSPYENGQGRIACQCHNFKRGGQFRIQRQHYAAIGRSSPVSTGRRKHRHKAACSKYGQTVHPRRLAQLSKTQNIERLLKLILVQGETIQNQISRLKERENQIEELEGEQHKNRVNVLGTNYLLETYLGSCEEKEDSGVATEQPSSENTSTPTGEDSKDEEITIDEDVETEIQDLRDRIHLLEKIAKVNKKLEKEEENLVRLFINVERCKKNESVIGDLQSNLQKLRQENEQNEKEYKENSKMLSDLETVLSTRKCYLKQLLDDFNEEECGFDSTNEKFLAKEKEHLTTAKIESNYSSLPSRDKPVLDTLV